MKHSPTDLRLKLFITIRGEEALDYGGVAKLVIIMMLNDSNQSNCDCSESYHLEIHSDEDIFLIVFLHVVNFAVVGTFMDVDCNL